VPTLGDVRRFALLGASLLLAGCGFAPAEILTPSPSPAVFSFVATDAEGAHAATITVVDFSFELTAARAATAAELKAEMAVRPMEGAAGGLTALEGSDRVLLGMWAGFGCDLLAMVTVSPGASSLVFAPSHLPGCKGPWPAYRGVVLTFSHPVVVADIELVFG
jgi:hypothetical protein